MIPAEDALYRIQEYRGPCRGPNPLADADLCERLRRQTETDLTQLLLPASELKVRVKSVPKPKFALGQLRITPAATDAVPPDEVLGALTRHASGDWGLLEPSDRRQNDRALASGGRLVSVYRTKNGCRFYVITDAGWLCTTILLPRDY